MKKIKNNKNEPWFKWLTRELNSYEAFQDFESGKNPRDVAEDFISRNTIAISEVFEHFDEEDRDTLDQFLKLTECEMHVFRILEKQIEFRNKVRFVDFKKRKKLRVNFYISLFFPLPVLPKPNQMNHKIHPKIGIKLIKIHLQSFPKSLILLISIAIWGIIQTNP